jgi:4-aminobutyrate aminotransferase-like enzyme
LELFKGGVIALRAGHYGNVVKFLLPLIITEELMMKGLEIFKETPLNLKESINEHGTHVFT